jgi:hypothetical protein
MQRRAEQSKSEQVLRLRRKLNAGKKSRKSFGKAGIVRELSVVRRRTRLDKPQAVVRCFLFICSSVSSAT